MAPTKVDLKFLIPGFSKCGTTTLCSLLNQHPDIFIPEEKEPWYFSSPRYEEKHQQYIDYFKGSRPGQMLGEGSTSYSGYKTERPSIARISQHHPDCKFIFIARDPIKRIESSYREIHHSGILFGVDAAYKLSDAMDQFPQMIEDTLYWKRISQYRDAFGDKSILVIFLEDLKLNPQQQVERCFMHIGVDDKFEITKSDTRLNAGSTKLYDTRLLRKMRNNRFIGRKLAKIDAKDQDKYFKRLLLRRSFKRPICWDKKAIEIYNTTILHNTREFLNFYGKPIEYWQGEISYNHKP